MKQKQMTIPIFVPHLGCPFDCVFCNQKKITGQTMQAVPTPDELRRHIDRHLVSGGDSFHHIEIGFFGGSFTGIDLEIQNHFLGIAQEYLNQGLIHGIRLSTRPDFIDDAIVLRLLSYGVTAVELGIQSFDNVVLEASGRGHTSEQAERALHCLKQYNIEIGIQLMLGLPQDSRDRFNASLEKAIAFAPKTLRLYPTLVIAETQLAAECHAGTYSPLSIEDAVDWCADAVLRLAKTDIQLIRLGLQASESLVEGESIVEGPWHPAFKTLVESRIYRRLWDKLLAAERLCPHKGNLERVAIGVHPKMLSVAAGHRQENLKWLKDNHMTLVKLIGDDCVPYYALKIMKTQEIIG